jgi:hypothetical protein
LEEAFLVTSLFDAQESELLIEAAENVGFGLTAYPKMYRGNKRLITVDHSLANIVWQRLRPVVPQEVTLGSEKWQAVGLNECWRLAKYYPGDRFLGHVDDYFQRSPTEQSMFTVNIYMNGGFIGGATRFFAERHNLSFTEEVKNKLPPPIFSATPKAGMCLVFRQPPGQSYFHDAQPIENGTKILFRSDVMYQKKMA